MATKSRARTPYLRAAETLAELGPEQLEEQFVRKIGAVLDELPHLAPYRWELVLAMESVLNAEDAVEAMAGGPAEVLALIHRENVVRAGARNRVLDEPMLEAEGVADVLGSRSVNRKQSASRNRRGGALLGIPVGNRYLFPAFQFDVTRGRIHPTAVEVNRLLDAAEDPWGVASWWISPNARLRGIRPADALANESEGDEVFRAARALVAPIG